MRTHRYTTPAVPGPFPASRFIKMHIVVPFVPPGLSRKRHRKWVRQCRRAMLPRAYVIPFLFRRNHPAGVLTGPRPYSTAGPRKDSVLDILDATPLNLQGTSPL